MTGKGLLPVRRKRETKRKKCKKKVYSHPLSDWMAGPQYLGMAEKGYCQCLGARRMCISGPPHPRPVPNHGAPPTTKNPQAHPHLSLGVLHILAENSRNCWKPWAPTPPPSLCCLFFIITSPSQVVTICLNSLDAPPPQTVSSSQHKEPWEGSEFLISVAGIPLCPAPPDHCHLGAGPQRADL